MTDKREEKEVKRVPAGKENDNYILTCANVAISQHEEPIKTGAGAVNKDEILATEIDESVVIKAEPTGRKENEEITK